MGKPDKKGFIKTIKALNNTTLLYDCKGIVIIRVNSFENCARLFNGWTKWCIAENKEHWDSYCAKNGREQYFIVDFNKISSHNGKEENEAAIGFTLNRNIMVDFPLYAAHAKNDYNLIDNYYKVRYGAHPFERILKDKGIYDFVVSGKMENGEIECQKKCNEDVTMKQWLICAALVAAAFITSLIMLL